MAADTVSVYASGEAYYNDKNNASEINRVRTLSGNANSNTLKDPSSSFSIQRSRRASHDDKNKARKFLLDVQETKRILVEQEDTDGDFQITVNDLGPKTFAVGSADSGGYRKIDIRGHYMLSNLLQELAIAEDYGRKHIILDEARFSENPVDRLSRMIRDSFWKGLTRRIDIGGLERICADPKNRSANTKPRIYIPFSEHHIFQYYKDASEKLDLGIEVEYLPENITPEYVQSINGRPGILALAMEKVPDLDHPDQFTYRGVPFVVPGGRFNEMYGWDSYFESLGLIIDNRVDLARGMAENFAYEIKHYGKILNANRSYYLSRSQPPFLTDMARQIYNKTHDKDWLRTILQAAIKEYHTVWMTEPRLDHKTGLSRYRPAGKGIPPETEASHFDHIILPYAEKNGLSLTDFMKGYNEGKYLEPELDEYFLHDRAVRESGHDTTYRFEKCCANLVTIDLNSLLYKYETDIADMIEQYLDHDLTDYAGQAQSSVEWRQRAQIRQQRINTYLWNEEKGIYFDYDTKEEKQSTYESVTAFWAMWAQCASQEQAERMTRLSLNKFEVTGGLVSGTLESRGEISLHRPNRQWDFPFGWAPHQILAWKAFENYGMVDVQQRLAYRWLYVITKSFVDFNGVVPEKYDVVNLTHKVQVEYGNVGVDFKYVPREGFGWMNASYQIGLSILPIKMRRALGACVRPDAFFEKLNSMQQREQEMAKGITQNGSTTAAITTIIASATELKELSSASSTPPSLTPDSSCNDIASAALGDETTPDDEEPTAKTGYFF